MDTTIASVLNMCEKEWGEDLEMLMAICHEHFG